MPPGETENFTVPGLTPDKQAIQSLAELQVMLEMQALEEMMMPPGPYQSPTYQSPTDDSDTTEQDSEEESPWDVFYLKSEMEKKGLFADATVADMLDVYNGQADEKTLTVNKLHDTEDG